MTADKTYEDIREAVLSTLRARDLKRYDDPRTDDDYILIKEVEERIALAVMEREAAAK